MPPHACAFAPVLRRCGLVHCQTKRANPAELQNNGITPLLMAAKHGNAAAIDFFVANNGRVNVLAEARRPGEFLPLPKFSLAAARATAVHRPAHAQTPGAAR